MREERVTEPKVYSIYGELENGDAFVFETSPNTLRVKLDAVTYITLPDFGMTYGSLHKEYVISQPQAKIVW